MWTGAAIIQPGWALFQGTAGDHDRHRHHAVQVAIGIDGPVSAWAETAGEVGAPGVVIAADCLHRIVPSPDRVLLLYVERESTLGRAIDGWCDKQARPLSPRQASKIRDVLERSPVEREAFIEDVVAIVVGSGPAGKPQAFSDDRIVRSLAKLPRPLPEKISVAELAGGAGISSGRYAHLFRAHTGMPVRPYLRWMRLQQAMTEVALGANLTQAAHAAGFADSAHLSRTFRRTFGVTPSALLHPGMSIAARAG